MRFVLFLLISINYFCSAIDGNVNQHRFLRPEEIEGQVLPKTQSKLGAQRPKLPDQMQDGQKNVRVVRKPPSGMVPLISLMPSLIQFPGSQQTTQIESSFSVEASLPLFANEHDLSAETVATQRSTSVSTSAPTSAALRTTTKDYELDEQSEQEVSSNSNHLIGFLLEADLQIVVFPRPQKVIISKRRRKVNPSFKMLSL